MGAKSPDEALEPPKHLLSVGNQLIASLLSVVSRCVDFDLEQVKCVDFSSRWISPRFLSTKISHSHVFLKRDVNTKKTKKIQ